jgi:hypothetical protein
MLSAPAVPFEQPLHGCAQAGGCDRAENVGEEVEADVVEVSDEAVAARPGEIGEEGGSRSEQR